MQAELSLLLTFPVPFILTAAYLSGSIPFGLLMARLVTGKDVRASGSGNIGATNVARVVGKKLGLLTAFLDIFKGMLPVLLVQFWVPNSALAQQNFALLALTGAAAFVGHCFPIWLRFKGGKGVATGAGVLLVLLPKIFAIGAVVFAATFILTRMVSLSAILGALALAVLAFTTLELNAQLLPFLLMLFILLFKHRSNMARILKKEEMRL